MKFQQSCLLACFAFELCTWYSQAVALRATNATERKRTGLLCREPRADSEDVDVVLEEDGRRSLLFSKNVRDEKGTVIGRQVAGMQSTVHCASRANSECFAADLGKLVPTCTAVGQSGKCPCEAMVDEPLKLPYQQQMVTETLKLCDAKKKAKQPFRVLMFGLGGGAVPMYIRHRCDAAEIESVEADNRVALIAQRLLGFKADSNNKVEIADGEEAAVRHAKIHPWPEAPHYDVVLVDCFDGDNHVSHSCRSDRFVHAVRSALAPDGHVFHNVMDIDVKKVLPVYQATFGAHWTEQQMVQNGQFIIVAKTHSNHPRHA